MREVAAEFANPVMLYSIGKDSSVMLHLAMKAFYPAKPPFPLLHVDTTWKFREMIEFRDETAKRLGLDLIVHINQEGVAQGINPFTHGSVAAHRGDEDRGAEAGARQIRLRRRLRRRAARRGKEPRQGAHLLVPRGQPSLGPEEPAAGALAPLQHAINKGESIRVFPLSNWTELDIWQYIYAKNIPIVPLYFAKQRPVVERDGTLIMVDDERMKLAPGEVPERAAGALPHARLLSADRRDRERRRDRWTTSSRRCSATHLRAPGPADRSRRAASMEKKKREGYF